MPAQVSVQAILDMAIQLEERGREFYATASELVGHPGAKELLRELAEDEVAHADPFRRVQERGDYPMAGAATRRDMRVQGPWGNPGPPGRAGRWSAAREARERNAG